MEHPRSNGYLSLKRYLTAEYVLIIHLYWCQRNLTNVTKIHLYILIPIYIYNIRSDYHSRPKFNQNVNISQILFSVFCFPILKLIELYIYTWFIDLLFKKIRNKVGKKNLHENGQKNIRKNRHKN